MARITVSMPCYLRPERTKRAIECILNQDINDWEAFIMGDKCPYFQDLIDSGYLQSIKEEQVLKGNIIHFFNSPEHCGGWGYKLTNHAIQNAAGKYFIFMDNDDVILPNHFRNYLSEIENTDYDLVYYSSVLVPNGINDKRNTSIAPSCIGHCDIIVRTEVARVVHPHDYSYMHDFNFIYEICKSGKCKKASTSEATYRVMRLPTGPIIDTID